MAPRYYQMCSTNIGKPVEIRMRDGGIHRGIITRVNNSHVYIRPLGRNIAQNHSQPKAKQAIKSSSSKLNQKEYGQEIWGYGRGFGGYPGYGYGGFGRFGWGWGVGIALAAIAAIAFFGWFWW